MLRIQEQYPGQSMKWIRDQWIAESRRIVKEKMPGLQTHEDMNVTLDELRQQQQGLEQQLRQLDDKNWQLHDELQKVHKFIASLEVVEFFGFGSKDEEEEEGDGGEESDVEERKKPEPLSQEESFVCPKGYTPVDSEKYNSLRQDYITYHELLLLDEQEAAKQISGRAVQALEDKKRKKREEDEPACCVIVNVEEHGRMMRDQSILKLLKEKAETRGIEDWLPLFRHYKQVAAAEPLVGLRLVLRLQNQGSIAAESRLYSCRIEASSSNRHPQQTTGAPTKKARRGLLGEEEVRLRLAKSNDHDVLLKRMWDILMEQEQPWIDKCTRSNCQMMSRKLQKLCIDEVLKYDSEGYADESTAEEEARKALWAMCP